MEQQNYTNGATIKVDSDVLRTKAEQVRTLNRQQQQLWDEIKKLFSGTNAYWQGEGAELFRKSASDFNGDIDDFFRTWEDTAVKLEQIAGVYTEEISANTDTAGALPTDVLK